MPEKSKSFGRISDPDSSVCNVYALPDVPYWTKLFSLWLNLEWFPYLFFQCSYITAYSFCLSAIKSSLLPLLCYSDSEMTWSELLNSFFSKCDCWRELRKAELIERSYLLSLRPSLFKENFKIQCFNEACLYKVVKEVGSFRPWSPLV